MQPSLSSDAQHLIDALNAIEQPPTASGDLVHVDGVGGSIYFAYEQLRNAAEYSEQHLLLRRAIERFLARSINLKRYHPLAHELVMELTQSRYIKNDSVSRSTVKHIDEVLEQFADLFRHIIKGHERNQVLVRKWILQVASVHVEQILVPQQRTRAFIDFAFHHYLDSIEGGNSPNELGPQDYEITVYCAVHRTIMKSDLATTRAYALASQILSAEQGDSTAYFVSLCRKIDDLYQSPHTNRLVRLIGQHGAPMRVLREIVITESNPAAILSNRSQLLGRSQSVLAEQYKLIRERLNNGIVRSIAFIAVTKILLGAAVEVPYDLIASGGIIWRPLIFNILFPPLYMAMLGISVRPPSRKNADIVEQYVDRIVFQKDNPVRYRLRRRVTSSGLNNTFNTLYFITFMVTLVALGYFLHLMGFNPVSGIIFFIFLSTVSFLGFRLMQTSREMEMIEARRGTMSLIADFFYTPFIRIGYWLSDKYAKINIVSRVLDILIEYPLKFVLRFMQQWIGFLRDKQEEL